MRVFINAIRLNSHYDFHVVNRLAKLTGKKLPISSIRVQKFCSSTEINSEKLDRCDSVRPFDFKESLQRTLSSEFGN